MGALVNLISIVVPLALIVMINQWKATTKVIYCIKWSLYPAAIFSYGLVGPLINPMFELPAALPMTSAVQGWLVSSLLCSGFNHLEPSSATEVNLTASTDK